jgi:hypothetical protein
VRHPDAVLSRRQFLLRSGALAGALALPTVPAVAYAQIRQACTDGLRVLLLPYRHPTWANGTAHLVRDSDAEIAFEFADRMSAAAWNKYVASGRSAAAYNPARRALEYRAPTEGYRLDGLWSRFFEFLMRRYHWGQRASGRYVHSFELVNEPNYQLWPQRARMSSSA